MMAPRSPLTTQAHDLAGDLVRELRSYFGARGGIGPQEERLLMQAQAIAALAARVDAARKLAVLVANNGDLSPWAMQHLRQMAQGSTNIEDRDI